MSNTSLEKIEAEPRHGNKSPVVITTTWDGVRHWINGAHMMEQGKLFCQAMTGLELLALHKAHNIQQGGDRKSNPQAAGLILTWEEICKKEAGISDDTARRYMDIARKAAPRLKRFPALKNFDPMATPIAKLSEPQRTALESAVKKITDGKSQMDFLGDLYKKAPGNKEAKDGGPKTKPTTADQAQAAFNIALENSGWMGKAVTASNKDFFLTARDNDLEIDAQIAVLEFALKLRTKYRNTPKAKREAIVAEILDTIAKDSPLKPA